MRRRALLAGTASSLLVAPAWAQQSCFDRMDCFGGSPSGRPSLDLQLTSGVLDSRIIYTGGNGTYFNSAGVLTNATTNVPRFDYNPVTLAANGLLIEESRVNLISPSVPTGANWALTLCTLTASATASPDGAGAGSLIAATTTANAVRAINYSPHAASASAPITVSAFFKAGPANVYIQVNDSTGAAAICYADLSAGTALVGADLNAGMTAKSVTIQTIGGGWYRVAFTVTPAATTTFISPFFGPCVTVSASGDNRSYVGVVGQGVYIWGAQAEVGAFATSYIPTVGAAVTRAADVASMPLGSWYNQAAGTVAANWIYEGRTAGTFPRVVQLDDGTNNNIIAFETNNGGLFTIGLLTAATQWSINNAAGVVGNFGVAAKTGVAWRAGSVDTATNALLGTHNSTAAVPAPLTTLHFGADGGAVVAGGIWLQRVRYWPRALGAGELQADTT